MQAPSDGSRQARRRRESFLSRIANHRTNLVNLERRRTDLSARMQKTDSEKEQLEARAQEIARQRDELARQLVETQEKRRALRGQKAATEEKLAPGRAEQRETEALLIKLREELADRRSRLTSLLELQKNFEGDRKSTRLNSSHSQISYAVFCLKKKKT